MKPIKTILKLQIPAGQATPAPPVGPALGQHGLDIQAFVSQFNEATREKMGNIIPVEVTVYEDRSFSLKFKTPPASDLLRKAAGIEKGSGEPNKNKVGKVSKNQIFEIAKTKKEDLNAYTDEQAVRIIEGTARSMGVEII